MLRTSLTSPKILLPTLAALQLCLTGCGGASATTPNGVAGKNLVAATSGGTANSISGFVPAAGAYTSVPSSIQIDFASGSVDPTTGSALSSYSISCGGNPLAPQGVLFSSGLSSVTVTLPSITGLANGTVCTFSVNLNLMDGNGNFVTGSHTVNYTISSSGSSSGGVWNEQASASLTSAVGTNAGTPFMGQASSGVLLTGLMLNGGTYVNGISGLWSNGFSSTASTQGPVEGSSTGGFTTLSCPSGMRITGITGRSGSFVDAIGIICMNQAQTQTYSSSTFGGSGGSAYTLSCPSGQFATDLDGMVEGSYLEELYLGCR